MGAIAFLAEPVVEQEVLRGDVALPLVLAREGGRAPALEVEDAVIGARMTAS